MAPAKPPYDPIVSVEGMYKGSLTRLGYFFKDPKHYGGATLAVLRESAKRYDDALDDCLIQILDAKWLLEHQLAQNHARRAREAAETEMESSKRKLESTPEEGSTYNHAPDKGDNPAKRTKVQHSPRDTVLPGPEQNGEDSTNGVHNSKHAENAEGEASAAAKPDILTAKEDGQKAGPPGNKESSAGAAGQEEKIITATEPPPDKPSAPPPEEMKEQKEQAGEAVQAGRTGNDEEMNLDSMFADVNTGNDQSNDLNFDLDLSTANLVESNHFDSSGHEPTNLELLPGLESYANASSDDFGMLNLPSTTRANPSSVPGLGTEFDLPEIQGDSNFDDLFADGDFGGDASLMDLDLENGFFDS
ncbi:hypothetical protein GJ744_002292 [Endocarpon pusillum]|uniref:Uncharacterized protein n=1 Tax=Endocarpon pusillum TaxID=364733 RepID=A0A8H7AMU8_9EURO|nr:hypothetical protein GJ744_002292 [Endocarpon pusillum]